MRVKQGLFDPALLTLRVSTFGIVPWLIGFAETRRVSEARNSVSRLLRAITPCEKEALCQTVY